MEKLKLPQLKIRTEFSFKSGAFGPMNLVAETLAEMGCHAAGITDVGTWGHVEWLNALKQRDIKPLFGSEFSDVREDGKRPTCWALAENTRGFYKMSSAAQQPGANIPELFSNAQGIVRFAGSALNDPAQFDYIDINPSNVLQQRRALELNRTTGKPLIVTSDNSYPRMQDKSAFMAISGRERLTPQHILHIDELRSQLNCLSNSQFIQAVKNAHEIAERCASDLPRASIISLPGNLSELALAGKEERVRRGHIKDWKPEYELRMKREIDMINSKGFDSYFFVVADLVGWAKKRMLVGPGRGSSAGSLICYLLRITEVDPIVHGLLFERFLDAQRNELPDIDIDLSDKQRDSCFDYLAEKYGVDKVARIGNVNTMKPRSVMSKICERLSLPDKDRFDVLNVLIEHSAGDVRYGRSLEDTMRETEAGRRFISLHSEATVAFQIENHASHTSVHAAGVIVCNEPISEFCTVAANGVIHGDKPYAESINLLKIDALGLSTLGIMEDAGVVTGDQLYALSLDDPKVFELFNSNRFMGVFQFEGETQWKVASEINIDDFKKINHIVALARPGPLGGGASRKYIERAAGREPVTFHHPSMEPYLAQTFGVILFQEQVMRICVEIGRLDWKDTSSVRKLISLRKGAESLNQFAEKFIAGAGTLKIKKETAVSIWSEMVDFGSYGFNESHSAAYGIISYWTAWLKTYHGLAYAAACLRQSSDENKTLELLRDMKKEGIEYIPFDIDKSGIDWQVVDGKLIGGFQNINGYGPAKAAKAIELRDNGKIDREKILALPLKFKELYPLNSAYADLYANPENHGCQTGSVVSRLNNLPAFGDVLIIGQVTQKVLHDENEQKRIERRSGKRIQGQTLFLDIYVTDDSGEKFILRVDRFQYESIGRAADENLKAGDVLLFRAKRIPNFQMAKVVRMKVLNREVNLS